MRVLAHRGARLRALENTAEALRIAFEEGADGVEFDVQVTADGEPVLFHDDDLRAMAGRDAPVGRLRWRELKALEIVDAQRRRGRVEHLDAVLELLLERRSMNNLELKVVDDSSSALVDAVLPRLARSLHLDWWISSFDARALSRVASGGLGVSLAALVDERGGDFAALAVDGATVDGATVDGATVDGATAGLAAVRARLGPSLRAVHPWLGHVNARRMARWRQEGSRVHPWTVNGARALHAMAQIGCEAVITDDPGAAVTALRRR